MTRSLGGWGNRAVASPLMVAGSGALDRSSKSLWDREHMPGSTRELYRRQQTERWPWSRARRTGATALTWPAGRISALRADDDVLVIGEAPHARVFPRMAAVVHHAGAGTTAAGLRAGVPTVGVPMITDQPFWIKRVHDLGAGPKAVPYKSLSAESLGAAISDAVSRDSYRAGAQAIGRQLASEDGTIPVIRALDHLTG